MNKVKKVKMQVYSLVSSVKHHSPNFTQLPPSHRTCLFISHLNSPESIQPGWHFCRTELFEHTSLHCPTRYPCAPGSRECTCKQIALSQSTTLEHIQHSRGSNPWSFTCTLRMLPQSHNGPAMNRLMHFNCFIFRLLKIKWKFQKKYFASTILFYSVWELKLVCK